MYRVIILPDLHIPYMDMKTLATVEKYMGDHKFDELLYLGDLLDFDFISKFNKESPRKKEGKRFKTDYALANKLLDRHQALIRKHSPKANFTLLEGNHDYRVNSYVDAHPEVEGMLDVYSGLKLRERGFKWVESWGKGDLHKIGKAYFLHGQYTNQYHAKKMVDNYGVNIYYGHTHDVMFMPKILKGKDKTLEGGSLGCLCELEQSYMNGKPNNWQQAFAVMHVDKDSGFYNLYTIKIFNHSFVSPDGRCYS